MENLRLLLFWISIFFVKSDQSARIIFEPEASLSCTKTNFRILQCTCSKGIDLKGNLRYEAFVYLKNQIQRQPRPRRLGFENCSFNIIGGQVFKSMNIAQPIAEVSFKGGNFTKIEPRAFEFEQSEKVKVSFENANIVQFKHEAFWSVDQVSIRNSVVKDFSTDMFSGMDNQSTVEIRNSTLEIGPLQEFGLDDQLQPKYRHFTGKTLTFFNVKFGGLIGKPFLNVALETLKFHNCHGFEEDANAQDEGIELKGPDVMIISDAKQVIFENSVIRLDSHNPINATADQIIFENCTFKEPQKKSLMGLVGIDATSQLVIKNAFVTDPARGFFQTRFSKMTLENITLDTCSGGCNLFEDFSCDSRDPAANLNFGFGSGLHCDEIQALLKNQTFCLNDNRKRIFAKTLCDEDGTGTGVMHDEASAGLIVGTALVIFIIIVTLIVIGYRWYIQDRLRRKQMEGWKFAYPQTTQYK